jgi:hypothetical protein
MARPEETSTTCFGARLSPGVDACVEVPCHQTENDNANLVRGEGETSGRMDTQQCRSTIQADKTDTADETNKAGTTRQARQLRQEDNGQEKQRQGG